MKKSVAILLISIISILILRFFWNPSSVAYQIKKESFWVQKANEQSNNNVIVLGDSRILYGVNPDHLKGNASERVLNFAFPSMSFTRYYLDRAEELLAQRSHIILGLTAESLTQFETDRALTSYESASPAVLQQFLRTIRILWPDFPLQQLIKTKNINIRRLYPKVVSEQFHHNGWIESHEEIEENFESMMQHYEIVGQRFQLSEEIVDNIKIKVEQWIKNGHQVSFFWACFEKVICEKEKAILNDQLKVRITKDISEAGAMLILIQDSYKSYDGDHLIGSEANRFSRQLID